MRGQKALHMAIFLSTATALLLSTRTAVSAEGQGADAFDWERAKAIHAKAQKGEKLSPEDQAYLDHAKELISKGQGPGGGPGGNEHKPPAMTGKSSWGLTPLTELGDNKYKGEDGGLYGGGKNEPPKALQDAAAAEVKRIRPLNGEGQPATDGRVVFISISMSNATQEFARFKQMADADADRAANLTVVDCAQGGQAMAEWTRADAPTWAEAERRLAAAGVTPKQVQIAWVKLANKSPTGDLEQHGRKLQQDTVRVLNNAKERYPNLRLAFLGSRIYGGYATSRLNPEPYAYEGAFAVRWLIQGQLKGEAALNWDPQRGAVKVPLLLWGPYLWADGTTPRKGDGLIWERDDFASDGTHPSDPKGRQKVAELLLKFCKSDPYTQPWFGRAK